MGEHDTSDSVADRRSVAGIRNHPNFNHINGDFDVCVLTLASALTFSSAVGPVCLPASVASLFTDQEATVTGWGDTSSGGSPSSVLHEVDVTIVANADCRATYGNDNIKE